MCRPHRYELKKTLQSVNRCPFPWTALLGFGCLWLYAIIDLASGEYQGENRINKVRSIIGKLTQRNPLFPYIEQHRQEILSAIKYKGDRAIIFTALINAAYPFGYDTLTILGKYFHVQDEVSSQLIINRMASLYASHRTLPNALYCVLPMYMEAGLIGRPKTGIYTKNELEIVTPFARELFIKSFFINNPQYVEGEYDHSEHPYFEFV